MLLGATSSVQSACLESTPYPKSNMSIEVRPVSSWSLVVRWVRRILGMAGMSSLLSLGVTTRSTMVTMQNSWVLYRPIPVCMVYCFCFSRTAS